MTIYLVKLLLFFFYWRLPFDSQNIENAFSATSKSSLSDGDLSNTHVTPTSSSTTHCARAHTHTANHNTPARKSPHPTHQQGFSPPHTNFNSNIFTQRRGWGGNKGEKLSTHHPRQTARKQKATQGYTHVV